MYIKRVNSELIKKFSILFLVTGLLFVILGVTDKLGVFAGFNTSVSEGIYSIVNPILTGISVAISYIGEWYIYLAVAIVLTIIPKTRYTFGLPLVAITILLFGGAFVFKHIFGIPRPDVHRLIQETGNGFPSGHCTYGTGFVLFSLYLYFKEYARNNMLLICAIVCLVVIGFSREYLGVHNFTDLIGGYLLGTCILSFGIVVMERFVSKLYYNKK